LAREVVSEDNEGRVREKGECLPGISEIIQLIITAFNSLYGVCEFEICVELSSTLEASRPFDRRRFTVRINCIPTCLRLYKR
jgi:hypothetical protein